MGALMIPVSYTFSRFLLRSKHRCDGFVQSWNIKSSYDIPSRPCTTLLLHYIIDSLNVVRFPLKQQLKNWFHRTTWSGILYTRDHKWVPTHINICKDCFICICLSSGAVMGKNHWGPILWGMKNSLCQHWHTITENTTDEIKNSSLIFRGEFAHLGHAST